MPARHQLDDDLREVSKLFASYRYAMTEAGEELATLIAYILPGTDERKADAASRLSAAHQVVDTESATDRARFLQQIRDVARTGPQSAAFDA